MNILKTALPAIAGILIAGNAIAEDYRIGTECTYPPYNYKDSDGNLIGFDIDVGNAICSALEANCEFVCQAWDGMIPGLLAGKYDLIVASMTDNDERRKKIDFTAAYDFPVARFVGRKGMELNIMTDGELNLDALEGKIVGVQRATTYDALMTGEFPDVDIKHYDEQNNVYLDLANGRLDLAFLGQASTHASFLTTENGQDFQFYGDAIVSEEYFGRGNAVALLQGQDDLRESISEIIAALHENGEINAFHEKHIGIPQK